MRNDQGSKREQGFALITVMLLLLVLTVLGIAALGSSSIENMLAGNMRLRERNISKANAGFSVGLPVIERALRSDDFKGFETYVTDATLADELRGDPFHADVGVTDPDIQFDLKGQTVSIDIDKMYATYAVGSAIEFAAGYEGIGKSAGGSGVTSYYRLNSTVSVPVGNPTTTGMIYKYIPK